MHITIVIARDIVHTASISYWSSVFSSVVQTILGDELWLL